MENPNEPSDRELMLAVRGGELSALDTLFVRHHGRIHAFLARLLGDRHVADDLVQDVFLRVLKYRSRYDGNGDFAGWLFRVARNAAASHYRRRRESPMPAIDIHPAADPSALDQLVAIEQNEQLDRALAALPFAHREVLLLRGTEGLSHREVALALGCTEGAARVRMSRALVALKREWQIIAGETQ